MQQQDRQQLLDHDLTPEEVERQLGLFADPPPAANLDRPCVPGDGIQTLSPCDIERCLAALERAGRKGRIMKFVPASGAASRMFKSLQSVRGDGARRDDVERKAEEGDKDAQAVVAFMESIHRFAFFPSLAASMRTEGLDVEKALKDGDWGVILEQVLDERGLGYAEIAKGLIEFHVTPESARTAFEEHLVEAAAYARDGNGVCRLHFTISPQHVDAFGALLARARPGLEKKFDVKYEVAFSTQKSSTDTIAADEKNSPFRTDDGALFFRPGGHGALIENLNDLAGDIVFVKDIDNVVPDSRKEESNRWKRILGGAVALTEERVHRHLSALDDEPQKAAVVEAALTFVRDDIGVDVPPEVADGSIDERRSFAIAELDKPIRACGMVKNEGEPGGGPFWVSDPTGARSRQIVESAQVDLDVAEQKAILESSTHFNPVDLVCAVRDWRGQPFDLPSYVDPQTVFIAEKSSGGRVPKALERPGLWNGSMANWITLFVEVPASTFNPVKTVNDLLRPEHQPALVPARAFPRGEVLRLCGG